MRVSGRKSPWTNPRFPGMDDLPLSSYHMGAQAVGDLFEELCVSLFCNEVFRLKMDSTADTCPDLQQTRGEFFLECKATGKRYGPVFYTQNVEDYDHLLETFFPKDPENEDISPSMLYVIWRYSESNLERFATVQDMRVGVIASIQNVSIIDHAALWSIYQWKKANEGVRAYGCTGWEAFFRVFLRDFDPTRPEPFDECLGLNGEHLRLTYQVSDLKAYDLCSGGFPLYIAVEQASLAKPSLKRVLEHWSLPPVQLV